MKKIFVLTLFLFLLATYATVHAEYKIILKNGGKFIASDYKKEGNSIKLYTPNGEIEIDKSNIISIKETEDLEKIEKTTELTPPKTDVKNIAIKEITSPIKIQDTENKTKKIVDKQKELMEKEKKLMEESKKLEEDINKEGRLTSIRKKREFEQRSKELKKKADEYNKEIESSKQK